MKLYLVRHGIAGDRLTAEVRRDFDRQLTDEGKLEAKAVAKGLKQLGAKGDIFVTSPLVRARQTAEITRAVLAPDVNLVQCDALAPGGNVSDLYKFLQIYTKAANEIWLFGHEPSMGRLASTLLCYGDADIPFKKSGVCRIDVSSIPPTMPGVLKWFVTPKIASQIGKS